MDVQVLVGGVAKLDISKLGGIIICVVELSSLFEHIKARRYGGLHLFSFREWCCEMVSKKGY